MVDVKQIGTDFEQEFCELLAKAGYWVHFITPDRRGAQPFDIIAVRYGVPFAIDCKTCVANTFNINRLEDNQVTSFDKWLACGNSVPYIAVKHKEKIYLINYLDLKQKGSVKIETEKRFDNCL